MRTPEKEFVMNVNFTHHLPVTNGLWALTKMAATQDWVGYKPVNTVITAKISTKSKKNGREKLSVNVFIALQ